MIEELKMKTVFRTTLALILYLTTNLNAQSFFVDSDDERNQATFTSDAPFEKIIGVSSGLEAMVILNKENIVDKPKGFVKVSIKNIKTGINLRDEHLRSESWLNAEQYPHSIFRLKEILNPSSTSLTDGKKINAILVGDFTLHGITHEVKVPASITYFKESDETKMKMPGNLLAASVKFTIKLTDYGIKIPSMVIGKVSEEVEIDVDFVAGDLNLSGKGT